MPRRAILPLDPRFLPERTRSLFDRLIEEPMMRGMTLVGGSALALQIGHRMSEDLDFAVFGPKIPAARIDALMAGLEKEGREVSLLTSQSSIERFKINTGKRLLDYARDYVVDGAKMTFFARGAGDGVTQEQLDWLAAAPRAHSGKGFDVLGVEGIFAMKALLLADRARSRDLFDLMALIHGHGYTLDKALVLVRKLAPIERRDIERHKAVMTGAIPLDAEDEGFEGIGVKMPIEDIYAFFEKQIAVLERSLARAAMDSAKARNKDPGPQR
jgi:hypothetical protein